MSENKKNVEMISFVHIGEDVIVPDYALNRKKGSILISLFLFSCFGGIWLYLVFAGHADFKTIILSALILFFTPIFLTIFLKFTEWFEFDRKDGVVHVWANNSRKRKLKTIKREDIQIFYRKEVISVKYGTLQYAISFKDNGDKTNKRYSLFVLQKGTSDCVAFQLTKEVKGFLDVFLNNKPVKPTNKKYPFTYHI